MDTEPEQGEFIIVNPSPVWILNQSIKCRTKSGAKKPLRISFSGFV